LMAAVCLRATTGRPSTEGRPVPFDTAAHVDLKTCRNRWAAARGE
jgi:hypothetical protein